MVNASGPTNGQVAPEGREHAQGGRHHPLRRVARQEHARVLLARLLHVLAEARAPGPRAQRREDLQLLHRHAQRRERATRSSTTTCSRRACEFIRGRVAEVSDWAVTPMEKDKLVIRVEDTLAGLVRRIPVDMVVLSTGLEAASRRRRRAPDVQHVVLERRLLPRAAPEAGAGLDLHRRRLHRRLLRRGRRTFPTPSPRPARRRPRPWRSSTRARWSSRPTRPGSTEERCSGCQICVPLCPFSAIEFNKEKKVSTLNEALCKGCGTCVAACPSHAAQQHHFTDAQIMAEIEGVLVR